MDKTARQIHNHLKKTKEKIVLVAHQNPDGDALGSTTAMHEYLKTIKQDSSIFCASPVPAKLQFLPNIEAVTTTSLIKNADTVVVLDSGDTKYAGIAEFLRDFTGTVINIDHHASNTLFGDINLVNPKAASTTQIVYYFLKHNNIRISRGMATSLLTGLITDTDNFFNPATSESALNSASELMRLGANWTLINNCVVKNKSINLLKLWGVILGRLEEKEDADIAYTYLTLKDIMQYGIEDSDAEGMANFLSKIDGAKITLFMKETADEKIKGSLRTTNDDVDVSIIAKKLGGGGHRKAAGFTAEGTMESIVDRVVNLRNE
ncbi:MAG: bifunctional oligoribonuclease/PAP phosphatase NrnA [Patescibacteria group bacterium]